MARIRNFGGYRRPKCGTQASRDNQRQINNTGMSIHLRYELGRLLRKCGYRITREYRWPEIHGNLLLLGFSLFRSRHHGLIQLCRSERSTDKLLIHSLIFFDSKTCLQYWWNRKPLRTKLWLLTTSVILEAAS